MSSGIILGYFNYFSRYENNGEIHCAEQQKFHKRILYGDRNIDKQDVFTQRR